MSNNTNTDLTRFNEGGLHSENKFGGVPVGGNNTVEEGETKLKNYVYSNRIAIDENMTKEMNLPSYIKGKTFASASKAIDNKFKDRLDKYSTETKNTLLERLKQAQETVKQQEQQRAEQIAQSMQSNQQEVPDMMNGEVPQGMEEFAEQPEQNQMFMGGDFNLAEAGNITGGLSGLAGKASPYLGAASGAMSLGSLAQGNGASTNKAQSAFSGAATGAQAGMAFGPWGAGIGAAVGLGAGLLGANKAKKQQTTDLRNNANAANLTDTFAYGGDLEDPTNPLFKPTNTIPQVGAGKPSDFLGYNIKPKNILPKPPTADMNTNIIQNFQDGLGMDPKTPGYGVNFGKQSNQLYFNDRIKRDPEYAAFAKKYNKTTDDLTNSDFTPGNFTEGAQKRFGITPQGYKYLDSETPDTSMLKSQEQPFVEPTGVKQDMEDYYQKNKTTDTSDTQNNQGNWLDRNGGKMLKYAPVAMNAYQLSQLKKPTSVQYDSLSNKYNPNYVDEAQLQNIANQGMTNQINSFSEAGGSQGALRSSILGAGLNKTKALSDAYINASGVNRQEKDKAQQFNLGVDQYNNQLRNKAIDEMRMDQANYRNEKSKYLGAIGSDLGSIGKEEVNKNQIAEALGYTVNGDYVVNKKTGEKMLTSDWMKTLPSQKAYGGFIKMNKIGKK